MNRDGKIIIHSVSRLHNPAAPSAQARLPLVTAGTTKPTGCTKPDDLFHTLIPFRPGLSLNPAYGIRLPIPLEDGGSY